MGDLHLSFPGGITGRVTSPHDDAAVLDALSAHAPGMTLSDPIERPTISLDHIPADRQYLYVNGLHATLYTRDSVDLPADIPHLLYGLARKALLERHLYPVHAACVGLGQDTVLLVGHSGSGKTTLAQALIDQDGGKLYSGNKTVIRFDRDGLKAVAGTRIMTAVTPDFNRHAYRLPEADCVADEEVSISRIAIIRINDGVAENQTLSPLSALHTLYPYFMDTANADVIVNGRDLFNGGVPDHVGQYLAHHLGTALHALPVRKISGSLPFMKNQVLTP